jgi:hypothetical protein
MAGIVSFTISGSYPEIPDWSCWTSTHTIPKTSLSALWARASSSAVIAPIL